MRVGWCRRKVNKGVASKKMRNKRRGHIAKYSTEFKEQALLLSDEIGVKKQPNNWKSIIATFLEV